MDYFNETENLLKSYMPMKKALVNLKKRIERLRLQGSPKDISSIDFENPYVSGGMVNDAYAQLFEFGQAVKEFKATKDVVDEIKRIYEQLSEESQAIINMCYFESCTKEKAAEELNCWSITTVYNRKNKAVTEFAVAYYGALAKSQFEK